MTYTVKPYEAPKDYKFKILSIGKAGSGKTTFAGTFPNPYFVEAGNELMTLRHLKPKHTRVQRGGEIYTFVLQIVRDLERKTGPFTSWYPETLIIDSLTYLSLWMEVEIAGSEKAGMEWSQYAIHKTRMVTLVNRIIELPLHIVLTGGVLAQQDALTKVVEEHINLAGQKEGPLLPHGFDEVYYHEVETARPADKDEVGDKKMKFAYVCYTKPHMFFKQSKTKIGLPERVVDPSFKKVLKYYQKEA